MMRSRRKAKAFVRYLKRFIGLPYRWGGDDPIQGFDCSGLVIEGLIAVGLLERNFDTTANGLRQLYSERTVDMGKPGVLAFFGTGRITHVGVCLDSELMLEAGGGNSSTMTPEDAQRQNAYIRIRPISSRGDLVILCDPFK